MHIFNKVLIKMQFVIKTGLIALFLLIFYTENFTQSINHYNRYISENQCYTNLKSNPYTADLVYSYYLGGTINDGTDEANGLYYLILDFSNKKLLINQVT